MVEVKQGAEAVVKIHEDYVQKTRVEKKYRIKTLDNKIRKERTRKEFRIMKKLHGSVNIPKILEVRESEFTIIIEKIKGTVVKKFVNVDKIVGKIGMEVGKLHKIGVAHNDLTTSNMIWTGDKLFLIDFGLAKQSKVEGFAMDLKVLRECMMATHESNNGTWDLFVKGYLSTNPEGKQVLNRLDAVYERGRYKVKN